MPATLTRGTTVTIDTEVTSQTLHNLIESALVAGITASDLIAGSHFLSVGTATPNPSAYPFWYNNDPEDPVMRYWAEPWKLWLACGPDRWEYPLMNAAATMLPMGCMVTRSGSSAFSVAQNATLTFAGFLQATTASGAYGPVCCQGIGWVLHISSPSTLATQTPTGGTALKNFGSPAGGVYGLSVGSDAGSGPYFGMFLESNRSGASGSGSRFRAWIWGPTNTVAP